MRARRRTTDPALLVLLALCVAGCSNPSDEDAPRPRTREEAIPSGAVKMTPETDLYPPILLVSEWFDPEPMEGPVNTAGAEDAPVVSLDGNTFLFFFTPGVSVPPERQLLDGITGIWWTTKTGGEWSEPERAVLNHAISLDGPLCIQGDLLWFASFRQGMYGADGDIYTATLRGGAWTDWRNAGAKLNSEYNVGELYTDESGTRMCFHRLEQSMGGYDLWMTEKVSGEWTPPVNLGAPVNSPNDEGWPWLSPDGSELWFTAWSGLGHPGPALFRTFRQGDGSWSEPEEIVSSFAGDPALDREGNIYFTHHFFDSEMKMIEADIYVAKRKAAP